MNKPNLKPSSPNFSSGPCAKRPGWNFKNLENATVGRSHRSKEGILRLKNAINETGELLNLPKDYILGTWWNHSIIKAEAQISAVSGRIIKQNVEFLGKEKIKIGNKTYDTLHFQFTSSDKKLSKDKKLNTHVWYDENTLNWVRATFDKSGKWEYKLIELESF